jgi:hypothetical protein
VAKVSALLWRYADLRKVITFDARAHDNLNRYGHLRSSVAQGHQPWGVEVEIDLIGVKAAAKHCKWDHGGRQQVVKPLSTEPLIWGPL